MMGKSGVSEAASQRSIQETRGDIFELFPGHMESAQERLRGEAAHLDPAFQELPQRDRRHMGPGSDVYKLAGQNAIEKEHG